MLHTLLQQLDDLLIFLNYWMNTWSFKIPRRCVFPCVKFLFGKICHHNETKGYTKHLTQFQIIYTDRCWNKHIQRFLNLMLILKHRSSQRGLQCATEKAVLFSFASEEFLLCTFFFLVVEIVQEGINEWLSI